MACVLKKYLHHICLKFFISQWGRVPLARALNWRGRSWFFLKRPDDIFQLVTGDGSNSILVPIVHGHNVSAMVAQLEHPININQDGMLDLLHHKVHVTVTEAKEAVPNASVFVAFASQMTSSFQHILSQRMTYQCSVSDRRTPLKKKRSSCFIRAPSVYFRHCSKPVNWNMCVIKELTTQISKWWRHGFVKIRHALYRVCFVTWRSQLAVPSGVVNRKIPLSRACMHICRSFLLKHTTCIQSAGPAPCRFIIGIVLVCFGFNVVVFYEFRLNCPHGLYHFFI